MTQLSVMVRFEAAKSSQPSLCSGKIRVFGSVSEYVAHSARWIISRCRIHLLRTANLAMGQWRPAARACFLGYSIACMYSGGVVAAPHAWIHTVSSVTTLLYKTVQAAAPLGEARKSPCMRWYGMIPVSSIACKRGQTTKWYNTAECACWLIKEYCRWCRWCR